MHDGKKAKLVIFSAFFDPFMSGAEQMAKEILERIGPAYETTLVTGRFDRKLPQYEKRSTYDIVRVGIGHRKVDKLLYVILAAWQARKIRPQLIHAIMESYAGGALVLAKYSCPQAKRLLTLQSGDLDSSRKQGQFFLRIFWKTIHRSPDLLTAISSFLKARAVSLGVSEENVVLTPNGVDFGEIPAGVEKIPSRVICVARLSWEKGLGYLVRAWPEVIREIPDARLVFVGEGSERKMIEELIDELGVADSVELKGALPHRQALLEISRSEVFICPSLAEGLGIVFIEAQACGVPPIGTRVGGIPDVIQDSENGLLIEPGNSKAIASALIRLLKDRDFARRLGANARESAKKFAWDSIMDRVRSAYENVLQGQ